MSASLLRQQQDGGIGRMRLPDRIFAASTANDVALLKMNAPVKAEVLQAQDEAQIMFAGKLFRRTLGDKLERRGFPRLSFT